jgi:ATP adenylyltransferase
MNYLWAPWRMPYLKNDLTDNDSECIFCVKTNTENDAAEHILYRDKHCFVTLNLYPYTNGHLLIVPYTHTGQLEDLSAEVAAGMMLTAQKAVHVLREAYQPEAYNMGINQGAAAGAGVVEHLHMHIVPRWKGDTNYMTVVGETRVIPEWIDETYRHLKTLWDKYYPPGEEK